MTFRRTFALSFLGGALAALGHAPFGLWPVALVGFSLVIWLVATTDRPARIGWIAGVGYFVITLSWFVEPFLVDIKTHGWFAPIALALVSAGFALFYGASAWMSAKIAQGHALRAIAFAVALTGAELLRGNILTGFPWSLAAYIWAETPLRVATAYTGSYGLTLLTLLAAALPVAFHWRGLIGGLAILCLLYALGAARMNVDTPPGEYLGTVRIVQPNVPQRDKWNPDKIPDHIRRMLSLTRGEGGEKAERVDLVLWPEASVAYPLHSAGNVLAAISRASAAGANGAPVIIGINRQKGEDWHNSLAVVGAEGAVLETYDKVHLVPFGEYIPLKINWIRAIAASSNFGFTAGNDVRLIDTPLGRALPLICYEGIFPGHIFRAGERPDYLLQMTNDAWFGTFSGPYQHLDQTRFRAAEQGLPLVRSANTGISTVIDAFGRTNKADQIALGETGFRDEAIIGAGPPTLFAYTGDIPVIVIVFITIGALVGIKRRNTIAKGRTTS